MSTPAPDRMTASQIAEFVALHREEIRRASPIGWAKVELLIEELGLREGSGRPPGADIAEAREEGRRAGLAEVRALLDAALKAAAP